MYYMAGCYLQPVKDKRDFSAPLPAVPSAILPGLSLQSIDRNIETHTELDFTFYQLVLWKDREDEDPTLAVEGRRVVRDMRAAN